MPSLMKSYTDNRIELHIAGNDIADVLDNLVIQYPQIKIHILDKNGNLRRYVNLFVNGVNIKELDGVKTRLSENDKIILLPSISGG